MWFSWQSAVTLKLVLLPHQHLTFPTYHPDHGWIISLLFNTFSPSGNSFPFPSWVAPFFLALTFIYFSTAPTFPPPKSFQAPTVTLSSKTSSCVVGEIVGLVHFGSGFPEGRRGGRFSLWPFLLLIPRGSQEASCLERWFDVRWVVGKFCFALGGKWLIPCESMSLPRPLRGCF